MSAALSMLLCGGIAARPSNVEARVEAILGSLSIEEKLGQLQQLDGEADGRARPEHADLVRRGLLGSTLNVRGAERVNALQQIAVGSSRSRIPLIFAFDVIHGYRTMFPIPLGEASSWDPALAERSAAIAAAEARAAGVQWTFAPMVDIARDPRWGRIAEGAGEDPWLGMAFARARVRGFQGDDYSRPDRVVACAKHFVAYGAPEGGRDYNSVDMSDRTLRSVYLPPFKAAVDAGAGTVMSAFNDLNGVPASANPYTLTRILRDEWHFDGVVVSDYKSVVEIIPHGIAADEADAARQTLAAGVDVEMVSRSYVTHGRALVESGRLPMTVLDEAVRRVLRVKLRAGLFEQPYADPDRERTVTSSPAHRAAAREIAGRSMVLLKNEAATLPLSKSVGRLALIGPLAASPADMIGSWPGDSRVADAVTIRAGIEDALGAGHVVTVTGCAPASCFTGVPDRSAIAEAVTAAEDADAIVLAIGESAAMSGEATSRASIDVPGAQIALARAVLDAAAARRVPVAAVLFNGRPLAVPELADRAPAILEAWQPGTEAGHAVADVLFGDVNPAGKLPAAFPRVVGQVPIPYAHKNTGRPPSADDKYTSKYIDVPWTPLYPFGHGLSYTTFRLTDLRISPTRIQPTGTVAVSADVENTGARPGEEVVQLYVRDVVASVTRPVQELRGFERVRLAPGERRRVSFTLGPEHLAFLDRDLRPIVEPGVFQVRVGTSSVGGLEGQFEVVP